MMERRLDDPSSLAEGNGGHMAQVERPLDNPINWSFKLGRVWAIDIRVHVAFIICAVVMVWMELPPADAPRDWVFAEILFDAVGTYALLFLVVLLHEFGHCWGARHTGGEAEEILLWPLGGLASVNPPHDPRSNMITTLAGPSVNVLICAVCSAALAAWVGSLGAVPWNPLHPMLPLDHSILPTTAQMWVIRLFGISYFLLLINMLPIFPFDGGRVLQAWLWSRKNYHVATDIATGVGMVGAILIGLFALFIEQSWLLMLIAVFGYMTCWQTRRMAKEQADFGMGEFGYDFTRGYSSLEQSGGRERRPGPIARWRAARALRREERERLERQEHRQAVDEVLRKVGRSGLASLNPRERRVLEKETRRARELSTDAHDSAQL